MILRDTKDEFDYTCTYVDDLKVVTKDSGFWADRIVHEFFVKYHGHHRYYVGNDYTHHDGQGMWTLSGRTYNKNDIECLERIYGCLSREYSPFLIIN